MKKTLLFTLSLFVVVSMISLTLNADDGTLLGEGEIGTEGVTDIWLEKPLGTAISEIPKEQAFFIWVMWEPPKDAPEVIYLFKIQQDTTRQFTHLVIKKNTMSGIIAEACTQAIVPWANSGQQVKVIGIVKGIGKGAAVYPVE